MNPLLSISPLDGRYHSQTEELQEFFSEFALMQYRVKIEIEYFIALSLEKGITEFQPLSLRNQKQLRRLYVEFSISEAKKIKEIESTTRHDVKAIEYYIAKKLSGTPLESYIPFLHFGITSEDINNLAYALMWKDSIHNVYIPELTKLQNAILAFAKSTKDIPLLAHTHGQPATPTTIGKEYAVFYTRIRRQLEALSYHAYQGKLGGATGTWSAHSATYPKVEWLTFSKRFVESLGLSFNAFTTQVESRDSLAESYHTLVRINTILIDLCRDTWNYISRHVLAQKKLDGEVGSSTMPHKINPIRFENAEGNCGIANALLTHLATKLPVSRMQRDLSDSTVLRNQGVALAHSLLSVQSIQKGFERIAPNNLMCEKELDLHWEVLAELIQTELRKHGHLDAYEILKEATQGKTINKQTYISIIESLPLDQNVKQRLQKYSPAMYTGYAKKLVENL